ncbi:MAG: type II toxin-antitoxin system RelE/ParE family toxin [Chitinivorax sp.]
MIKTFANKETAALFADEKVRRLPPDMLQVARRKLAQLHRVASVDELRIPPGNRLEKLAGDRTGFRAGGHATRTIRGRPHHD